MAWRVWREDFCQHQLSEEQRGLQEKLPKQQFRHKMRSVHNAHVQQVVGDTHLAKALLQHGFQSPAVVQSILQEVKRLKGEARRTSGSGAEPAESATSGGVAEPGEDRTSSTMSYKEAALTARRRWRLGRCIYCYVSNGWTRWDELASDQQSLFGCYCSGELARAVDEANLVWGHSVDLRIGSR